MAPVALVLTTHLLMQQVGWRRGTTRLPEPMPEPEAGLKPAQPHTLADDPAPEPPDPNGDAPVGARARVRVAYEAQLAAGQTPTGAGLARSAGVSERYGQRLLAEFTANPAPTGHHNGDRRARIASKRPTPTATERR